MARLHLFDPDQGRRVSTFDHDHAAVQPIGQQILESLRNKKFFKERRALIKRLNDTAKIEKFI